MRKSIEERFWEKVDKSGTLEHPNCWEWTAGKAKGYGKFWFQKRLELAHRIIWTLEKGEISKDVHVLHHCDNPPCVRIDHLFLGTHKDNMKDRDQKGRFVDHQAKKTHCPQGHPYSGDNLYKTPNGKGKHRECKICAKNHMQKYYIVNREKKKEYDRNYYRLNKNRIIKRALKSYYEKGEQNNES